MHALTKFQFPTEPSGLFDTGQWLCVCLLVALQLHIEREEFSREFSWEFSLDPAHFALFSLRCDMLEVATLLTTSFIESENRMKHPEHTTSEQVGRADAPADQSVARGAA